MAVQIFRGISQNSQFLDSVIATWGLTANLPSGGEENIIVYSLFCLLIIIIIIIVSSSSISLLSY